MSINNKLIEEILITVQPDLTITHGAAEVIQTMLNPLLKYFDVQLAQKEKKEAKDIINKVVPGELGKHAYREYMKEISSFTDTPSHSPLRIIEYLISEILDLSGNEARDQKTNIITRYYIYKLLKVIAF